MIVKQSRSGKRKAAKLIPHLLEGAENEEIHELHGDVEDIVALSESRVAGTSLKHEMRQFIISPDKPLTPDQERRMVEAIIAEMGAESFEYAVVKHVKPRADGNTAPHYHIVMPERDANGRALDKAHFKVRNEKVARLLELEFGHSLTKGKHNRAVLEHLKSNGFDAEAAAIAPLAESAPALSQFSGKSHQIAKRVGVDLPKIAQTLKPGKGEGGEFHAAQIAQMLRDHPNARVVLDPAKGHLALTGSDGTFIASLNRVAKIERADNAAILNRIEQMNAQETPDAHLPTISNKETAHDGRTATTTRTDATRAAERAEAQELDTARIRVDQIGHERDRAEARPSVEPRPIESVPVGPASGNVEGHGRGNDRDAADLNLDSRGAGRAAIRDRLSVEHDGAAPRDQSASRALSAVEVARLRTAWTTSQPKFSAITTPLADARPRSEIMGKRPSGAPHGLRISKVQEGRLRAAFAPYADHFNKHKVEPSKVLANASPRSQVQAKRPSLPPTKTLLNELQKARLNAALTDKRDALIAAAAFRKPERAEERTAIRPSGAMLPEHAAKLSSKQLRDAFAEVKALSGNAQKDAIASLLKAHGLHLDVGAKSGVITINRRLSNGSAEFLGSLDRFANLKTVDADRGPLIASIMKKVNASEAPKANLPSNQQEARQDVRDRKKQQRREDRLGREGRSSAEIWQHYAAGISAKAGSIKELERIRTSGIREAQQLDSRSDQARHERDQELDRVSRTSRSRSADSNRSNDSNDGADVRENGSDVPDRSRSASDHQRPRGELQSDAQRDRLPAPASQQAPTLSVIEKVEIKSAMMIYESTIAAHSAPMTMPGPSPKPDLAPAGKATSKRPSADIGHSARLQASDIGGPVVIDITKMDAGEALKAINEANARSAGFKM